MNASPISNHNNDWEHGLIQRSSSLLPLIAPHAPNLCKLQEEQTGVTVPFYFICLLHLANEKGLKLEGRDDLLDFSVASDPVKEGSY
ncbi:unnamed protein product [Ectocarpus sp. 4 AP-2014]